MDLFIAQLGRFHLLILHLPIGFLLALTLFRLLPSLRQEHMRPANSTLWTLALLSTIAAAISGWSLIWSVGNDWGALATTHQWLGTSLALCVLLAAMMWYGEWTALSDFGLAVSVVLMVITAHYGGSMTHGKDFLWEGKQPPPVDEPPPTDNQAPPASAAVDTEHNIQLWQAAAAIFKEHCLDCHNDNRQRGYLNLASHAKMMRGSSSGMVVKPGQPSDSLLLTLTKLPADSWDRMPPKGDGLSAEEIASLEHWIAAGAPNEAGQIEE